MDSIMDTSNSASAPTTESPSTEPAFESAGRKRQFWGINQKRQIVEETLVSGASVARVARARGVNANQVFYWRRQYREGLLGSAVQLVPVSVEASSTPTESVADESPVSTDAPGLIQIKWNGAQIRIEGSPDLVLVRSILETVRG
jgi:transposase